MVRVLFAGCPEAAGITLKYLLDNSSENNFQIVGVLTNPPTAKGRHKDLIPTPVAQVVIDYLSEVKTEENSGQNSANCKIEDIPIFTPEHLDSECRQQILSVNPDILVCFAYGHIFGPKFLEMFKYGGMNLHPSLLPKYRGCTPVPAAILNRDSETAFTIQTISLKMDEGNILAQEKVSLDGRETASSLLDKAAISGAKLICNILSKIENDSSVLEGIPQSGEASYTGVISHEDGKIDWSKTCYQIDAQIRAYNPEPGCYCQLEDSSGKVETLKIIEAIPFDMKIFNTLGSHIQQTELESFNNSEDGRVLKFDKASGIWIKCNEGFLCVKKLQKQGKNVMDYKDFMNGARNFIGILLK